MAADRTSPAEDAKQAPKRSFRDRVQALRAWTFGRPLRAFAVGGGLMLLVLATVGTWLYLATLTVSAEVPTLADALEAYDAGDLEEARLRVARMTGSGELALDDHGGALFVLGATKAAEADSQWSAQLRRSQFLVATKYLQEAKALGFPPGREPEGKYLLGRSLIESGDIPAGVQVLEEALETPSKNQTHLHFMLATAYRKADPPNHQEALAHIDRALESPELVGDDRISAFFGRADALANLHRFDEARDVLSSIPVEQANPHELTVASAQIAIAQQSHHLATRPELQDGAPHVDDTLFAVVHRLQAIPPSDEAAEDAMYLMGKAWAVMGDTDKALKQFERVRNLFSATPASIAASVVEGDLYREQINDPALALTAYRRCLSVLDTPAAYRSRLMPLHELRQRMLAAHADFVAKDEYVAATTLVEQLAPLLGKTKQLELKASTLSDWGNYLLAEADARAGDERALRREARLRLREAGVEYEQLAKRVFATSGYTDAVWRSAANYLRGQSYASSVRMLQEYLRNESVQRNAQALLRLGQAQLAQGKLDEGIRSLQECIELHPMDAAVFRARLDCARALRDRSETHEAEQLLLANLNGSGQSPQSPEWRDSLFELGHLLHEAGRHQDAIDRLDEAVRRYPQARQARLANYLMAESHRHAADAPLQGLELAKTANERENSINQVQSHLHEALRLYEKVRREISNSERITVLDRSMLRNCYMFKGSVLFELGRVENSPQRFKEAIDEYSNVSTLYQNDPFVLETFVQIANCQRRLNQPAKARLNIDQALQLLEQLPPDADFLAATAFSRNEWELMLTEMRDW